MITYDQLLNTYFSDLKTIHILKLTGNDIKHMQESFCSDNFIHNSNDESIKLIIESIAKFILFSAYSKSEIEEIFEEVSNDKIFKLVEIAYEQRYPNRRKSGAQNGIFSEVLLDLILTLFYNVTDKFSLRHIYRQKTDKQEIKGYDTLLFFNTETKDKKIVLGQAKMGNLSYCLPEIISDIKKSIDTLYFSDQIYFYADKLVDGLSDDVKKILKDINKIGKLNDVESYNCKEEKIRLRNQKLVDYLETNKIEIIIPCLVCFENHKIYDDKITKKDINDYIYNQIYCKIYNDIRAWLEKEKINFNFSIFLVIFPFKDLNQIRNEETGVLSYVGS